MRRLPIGLIDRNRPIWTVRGGRCERMLSDLNSDVYSVRMARRASPSSMLGKQDCRPSPCVNLLTPNLAAACLS